MNTWHWPVEAHHYTKAFYDLNVPLKYNWVVRIWNCLYYPDMNGLDNAAIKEVLGWKMKFSVNWRILSRKPNTKRYMVCLFNKFVCFFLEQVPHIIKNLQFLDGNIAGLCKFEIFYIKITFQFVKHSFKAIFKFDHLTKSKCLSMYVAQKRAVLNSFYSMQRWI